MKPTYATDDGSPWGEETITRGELCKTAGIPKTTVRNWEKTGKLQPIVDERGVHHFRLHDVKPLIGTRPIVRLARAHPLKPSSTTASGALAADVFERLDRGVSAVTIVKELRTHPDVVSGLVKRWAGLKGGIFLTEDDCDSIHVATKGPRPRDARELVTGVQRAMAGVGCKHCESFRARYCGPCVNAHIARMRARWEANRAAEPEPSAER
jgi:hypothetical protein